MTNGRRDGYGGAGTDGTDTARVADFSRPATESPDQLETGINNTKASGVVR